MTDRKQARAMDLPGFPCPPFVRDIPNHAGSWGWVEANNIAQDDEGYLWARGNSNPTPSAGALISVLTAWSPDGIAAYVPPAGYSYVRRINGKVDESTWVPIASVMKDPPGYAVEGI